MKDLLFGTKEKNDEPAILGVDASLPQRASMQSAAGPDHRPRSYHRDWHGKLPLQTNGGGEEEGQGSMRLPTQNLLLTVCLLLASVGNVLAYQEASVPCGELSDLQRDNRGKMVWYSSEQMKKRAESGYYRPLLFFT
jgi:hypothetical protein